jgi:DNA (cytosine-5)-methyltransferase 1
MRNIAIDAFCGAGGLSLGFSQAGLDVAFAFDLDETALKTYQANLKHQSRKLDANQLTAKALLAAAGLKKGEVSVLAGGPPCQGFSIQRRGKDQDERNDLLFRFIKWVDFIEPAYFLIENVSGLRGKRGQKHLSSFIRATESLGYHCHTKLLNVADYGLAQIRKRLVIVGERPVNGGIFFSFPKATHSQDSWVTVRKAIHELPSPPADGSEHPDWPNHRCDRLSAKNKLRISHVPEGGGREDIPVSLRLKCHQVSPDKAGHRYVYGRLAWDRPAGTITARFDSLTRGRFGHPSEDRTISLREGARLQGFPDEFVFSGTKVEVARQIGNAVPPPLAFQLGTALLRAIKLRMDISNQEPGTSTVLQKSFGWAI